MTPYCCEFLLRFDRLLLDHRQSITQCLFHLCSLTTCHQAFITALHCDLCSLSVFVFLEDDVGACAAVRHAFNSCETFLCELLQLWRKCGLTARVLNDHSTSPLLPELDVAYRTRRWCVLGICISSRYFATVRRVTWIPCRWSSAASWSSVSGFRGSSSSIS